MAQVAEPGQLRAAAYLRVSTEDQRKGYGIAYTGRRVVMHIADKGWAFWPWVWELQDLGVFTAVVVGGHGNTTEEGESRMRKAADRAEDELIVIRNRTQGGIQEKAECMGHEGACLGGSVPYGYRVRGKGVKGESRLEPDECDCGDECTGLHEADGLHLAVSRFVTTRSYDTTGGDLNSAGYRRKNGALWD
ncbi:hypothetical protein ACH4FA_34230 [Streptomyces sp. NPDC017966]|uniref:hypothetical protein n=1 Tax=Streptomyces sp. NPDC017966 TaxID=3365023 RepID=UPI00379613F7